ncbi:1-phosphofructokinase family hexose kinase [Lacihabitans sp. CCS-44]|uniref:1-phosphofructokinase family hexose kinase n=1 Tax=Lacihabitans sp. CCS-44 TaxID=2487331 RepID=UPI0020CDE521|nr:1-phosphofructokinase family hexose kinase [Lacihabitans sp. CCS-44]MCP9753881.1 1-phosphofructokinase family hexose kinase [Lacihabitans sp. CCS-44]
MTKIITLTINPAVDKNTKFEGLVAEHKIRCEQPVYDAGGGGINVSKAINRLGSESTAFFPAGGPIGDLLKSLVKKEGVVFETIESKAWTRENFIAVDTTTNAQYRFGMPSPELTLEEFKEILEKVKNQNPEILVVSGSLPEILASIIFKRISEVFGEKKPKIVVDTSGDALKFALENGVYLIKPNHKELAKLLGLEKIEPNQVESAAKALIAKYNCEIVVVSMGSEGAMLFDKDNAHFVAAPKVEKKSTVGAGDSMVGGMVWALSQDSSLIDILKWGVACGSAATMNEGTQLFKKEDAVDLYFSL